MFSIIQEQANKTSQKRKRKKKGGLIFWNKEAYPKRNLFKVG